MKGDIRRIVLDVFLGKSMIIEGRTPEEAFEDYKKKREIMAREMRGKFPDRVDDNFSKEEIEKILFSIKKKIEVSFATIEQREQ